MSEILQGERVFFPEDQFDPQALQLLEQKATALGAEVITERDTATITIVNPRSHAYAKLDQSERSKHRDDLMPYHWLSTCLLRQTRVALPDLAVPVPIFVHPDRSKDHAPLKVWVSINIHRAQGEVPQEAQATVTRLFEERGALALPKRAHADVLVVDKESKFYATVIKETKEHGRDWQKVVQRDWVEDCVNTGKLGWAIAPMAPVVTGATTTAEEQDNKKDNDSFEDEPAMPKGRGPGRPAGKPRIEYTPEDDEFLVRYLAAHFPFGAWGSRKTFNTLAASAAQYPIAERHSDQSWHERFKKNSTAFSKRVDKFIRAGVDASLKTAAEREKAREKEQEKQEKRQAEVSREAKPGPSGAQAGPSSFQPTPAAGPARGATATSPTVPSSHLTNRRMLVSADSDEEAPASHAGPVHQNGHGREAHTERVSAVPAPTETRVESGTGAPAPDQQETVVVVTESILPPLESESISSPAGRRLQAQESREEQLEIERTLLVVQQSQGESLETQGSNGHDESLVRGHGEETQALLGDFARARQEAKAAAAEVAMGEDRAEAPVSAGETTIGAVPMVAEEAVQPLAVEQPRRNVARRRAQHETESTVVAPEAPAPSHRRRSALQAELEESTAKRSKRSSIGTSPHRPRPSSPDRIAARAIVPPPRQSPLQQSTGQAQGSTPIRRAENQVQQERLTPRQHAESVLRGQQLVLEQRDRYRAKIAEYEKKYGLTAKEVLEEVRKLRVKSGSWDVIDAGLRERFGW